MVFFEIQSFIAAAAFTSSVAGTVTVSAAPAIAALDKVTSIAVVASAFVAGTVPVSAPPGVIAALDKVTSNETNMINMIEYHEYTICETLEVFVNLLILFFFSVKNMDYLLVLN